MDIVEYGEFAKLDLRVGRILEVEDHPNADRLFVMKVDLGEAGERVIVAGLKGYYSKEKLSGKKAIFVSNLAKVNLRGVESEGMILAAVSEGKKEVVFLTTDKDIKEGTRVS